MDLKLKKTCPDCNHPHRKGKFCHVFAEGASDALDDLDDGEESLATGEDEDDDSLLGTNAKDKNAAPKLNPNRELPTPSYVRAIGFIRCNCLVGVPENSDRYQPVPKRILCGKIFVQTYDEIHMPKKKGTGKRSGDRADDDSTVAVSVADPDNDDASVASSVASSVAIQRMNRKNQQKIDIERFGVIIPLVMRFVPLNKVAFSAKVSVAWHIGVCNYREYVDMRDAAPWNVYRPHMGRVDSVILFRHVLFSAGDRAVMGSDIHSGESLGRITRDSGSIPVLFEKDGHLYCCSSNGSIRTFLITHNLSRMTLEKTMWEHSRSIRQALRSFPTQGRCEPHGIEGHNCFFYTCSEDRQIKIWDCMTYRPMKTIEWTSEACIFVFSKTNSCDRTDIHACSTEGASKIGCLQVTLRLPAVKTESGNPPSVNAVLCTGPYYVLSHLYAGDSTGQLTVWQVPFQGKEYKPITTFKAHNGSCNKLVSTYKHLISIGDDGILLFVDLEGINIVRRMNVQEEAVKRSLSIRPDVPRRLKCMFLKEDPEEGGTVVVGTNYGDVYIIGIGTCV